MKGENGMRGRWMRGLAIFSCCSLAGCASLSPTLDPPQIEVVKLEPEWASPESTSYLVEIKVRNANPMTLLLARLDVTLTLGKQVARQTLSTQMPMVPAFAEKTLSASLRLLPRESQTAAPQRFTVSGKLHTASQWQQTPLSFKQEFDRSSPLLPGVTLTKVRTVRSLGKQFLLLSVANPNLVPISLRRIRAEIKLAGQTRALRPVENELGVGPGKTSVVSLALEGMPLTPQNKKQAVVTGEMEFTSPAGRLLIPLPSDLP